MAECQHLNRAPIREAVIDIQFPAVASLRPEVFFRIKQQVGYAKEEPLHTLTVEVKRNAAGAITPVPPTAQGLIGSRYISADGKFIVQMRVNGMTLSRLTPYQDWGAFVVEGERLWRIILAEIGPSSVSRIAVRNINRLVFPTEEFNPRPLEFLAAPPLIPPGSPSVAGWLSRVHFVDEAGNQAFLTQFMEPHPDPKSRAVILDVDAFREEAGLPFDPGLLMPKLTALRDLKNRLFFSALTDKAINLLK